MTSPSPARRPGGGGPGVSSHDPCRLLWSGLHAGVRCDEEMGKTNARKAELSDEIVKLTAENEKAAARPASLKEEVQELQAQPSELARQQAEMDKIREDGHAAYAKAKADLEQGCRIPSTAWSTRMRRAASASC